MMKKRDKQRDLMDRLLEDKLREDLRNAQLIQKRRKNNGSTRKQEKRDGKSKDKDNMVVIDEYDTLDINGKQYNTAKRPTLTPKQVRALKSDNILRILQSTIQDKNKKHYILETIIKDIKEKNQHQKGIKEALGRYIQHQEREHSQKRTKEADAAPDEQSES